MRIEREAARRRESRPRIRRRSAAEARWCGGRGRGAKTPGAENEVTCRAGETRRAGLWRDGAALEDLSAVADADLSADISPTVRSRSKTHKPAENRSPGAGIAVAKAIAAARLIDRQASSSKRAHGRSDASLPAAPNTRARWVATNSGRGDVSSRCVKRALQILAALDGSRPPISARNRAQQRGTALAIPPPRWTLPRSCWSARCATGDEASVGLAIRIFAGFVTRNRSPFRPRDRQGSERRLPDADLFQSRVGATAELEATMQKRVSGIDKGSNRMRTKKRLHPYVAPEPSRRGSRATARRRVITLSAFVNQAAAGGSSGKHLGRVPVLSGYRPDRQDRATAARQRELTA